MTILYTCMACCSYVPEELVLDEREDGSLICPDPDCRGTLIFSDEYHAMLEAAEIDYANLELSNEKSDG